MKIFVTGTDTDAGKTVACAWLCLHSGADYWKPIQSGYPPDRDADTVSRLSGAAVHPERHMLRAPLSPLHAGRLENLCIDIDDFRTPSTTRPLVIEGAGGVLVPVNERATMLDLITRLGAPVIVAARSGLGTINHTCLTLMALRAHNIPVFGVVLSGPLHAENREAIEHFGNVKVVAEIPPLDPLSRDSLARVAPLPGALDWIRWKS
ncbi:dethiobiotin synthetase [Humidesulfovibrio mexicanus]|uniref:ATP-dependent dethiobiotin synthetase BioD n=1 Tax=Humidesulfovibrio mexicanus TaxID=147047 RepID=A0A238XRG1_9BACT|nr:dethiobiotin synthase [Humidesulfovibrio mexicanus]SNR61537.1 dethiobiotin synthetase [Humidesulfovibrio mexicanus]